MQAEVIADAQEQANQKLDQRLQRDHPDPGAHEHQYLGTCRHPCDEQQAAKESGDDPDQYPRGHRYAWASPSPVKLATHPTDVLSDRNAFHARRPANIAREAGPWSRAVAAVIQGALDGVQPGTDVPCRLLRPKPAAAGEGRWPTLMSLAPE